MGYVLDPEVADRSRRAVLRRIPRGSVHDVVVRLMEDEDGEAALEVSVVVSDEVIEDGALMSRLQRAVLHGVRDAGVDLWPYVRFISREDAGDQGPAASTASA